MTFAEFQATRRAATREDADRLGYVHPLDVEFRALLYLDALLIEDTSTWAKSEERYSTSRYYLIIGNQQFLDDDLEVLERLLYEWALSCGYGEEPA